MLSVFPKGPITHNYQCPWRLHRCRHSRAPFPARVAEQGRWAWQLSSGGGRQEAVPAHLPGEWVWEWEAPWQRDQDVGVVEVANTLRKSITLRCTMISASLLCLQKTYLQLEYISAKMSSVNVWSGVASTDTLHTWKGSIFKYFLRFFHCELPKWNMCLS